MNWGFAELGEEVTQPGPLRGHWRSPALAPGPDLGLPPLAIWGRAWIGSSSWTYRPLGQVGGGSRHSGPGQAEARTPGPGR